MAGIDDERVALRAPEVNRGGQARDAAADDDDFARLRIVEIFVLDHGYSLIRGHACEGLREHRAS